MNIIDIKKIDIVKIMVYIYSGGKMIGNEWDTVLKEEYSKEYFEKLMCHIKKEYEEKICYPEYNKIFNAFKLTDYNDVSVVILGQDPYHGEGEAQGLAFSVNNDIKIPPSLRNIFKELEQDLGVVKEENDLSGWAKQGVLLLNTVLTVVKDQAFSHNNIGWEIFTDEVIKKISDKEDPVIFILWGNHAQKKIKLIASHHFIIKSPHPSPLGAYRGFYGSKPFSKCNLYLNQINKKEIDFSK